MIDTDYLNEWNNAESGDLITGRPQWFKLWAEKYSVALDIDFWDEEYTDKEKKEFFEDIGRCFVNSLFYYNCLNRDENKYSMYSPKTHFGRILWHALKRDIDQSFRDYIKKVENGKKGGRPPKKEE